MKKTMLLILLSVSLLVKAQDAPVTIPFTLAGSGHIIIKATMDGEEGNFVFDTGAGLNAVFGKYAKKLHAQPTHHFFVGHRSTGEEIAANLLVSKELSLGTLKFKDQYYCSFDLDLPGIDGLISLQAFRNIPVTIDYTNKTLTFGTLKPADKKRSIDIQLSDHAGKAVDIFTNVKLNDTLNAQVLLDAGSGKDVYYISSRLMKPLSIDTAGMQVISRKSEFDTLKTNRYYIGALKSITTENGVSKKESPRVVFVEGLIYEGLTSINWLGKKIAISIPEKKIYIIE
ncbi:retropepsin-like aspartic protease [Filimonas effusa]|uniref:Aspartyl protease n=1 Tax=Filimonas effusa TaxID=2508721 RepID=A0A4Q1D6I0_9BACT|nr:retropepsin-like aspartic protease [Filimonas effusa]RXK83483.1 hypothetical protein ESB13_15425 [Filimonas effusa]